MLSFGLFTFHSSLNLLQEMACPSLRSRPVKREVFLPTLTKYIPRECCLVTGLSSLPHKIKHLETTAIVSCFYISLSINVLVLFSKENLF